MRMRALLTLTVAALALALACVLRLAVGGDGLALPTADIVWELRGLRVVSGVIVGASLGIAGVMLQALLRNPLASPDLLGLSAGSGLAVSIAMYLAWKRDGLIVTGGWLELPALLGSMAALAGVYVLAQRRARLEPISLILVGVIVGVMCAAGSVFVQHLLPDRGVAAGRWMMGALRDDVTWSRLVVGGSAVVASLALGLWLSPAMDRLATSEEEARALGARVGLVRVVLFVASGVLTAVSVALAGPIGFVGLVCPHLVRMAAGPRHGVVLVGAAVAGAALVVGADAGVKAAMLDAGRMPIGVITAMVGGPVFLWLLIGSRRRGELAG